MSILQKPETSWEIKSFEELSLTELHDLLRLRVDIFVVEQACAYPEIDGEDPFCMHVLGKDKTGEVIATARIAPAGVIYPEVSIGRVAIREAFRSFGFGKVIMKHSIDYCKDELKGASIKIAAQLHLKKFYSDLEFEQISEVYLWDGIEHIDMRYTLF